MNCFVYVVYAPICTMDSRHDSVEATHRHILCEKRDHISISESVPDSLESASKYRYQIISIHSTASDHVAYVPYF
jgi:hypothetical protein